MMSISPPRVPVAPRNNCVPAALQLAGTARSSPCFSENSAERVTLMPQAQPKPSPCPRPRFNRRDRRGRRETFSLCVACSPITRGRVPPRSAPPSKMRTAGVGLLSREHERRREADRVLSRAEHEEPPREAAVDDGVALFDRALLRSSIAYELDADISPRPRTSPMKRMCVGERGRSPFIRCAPTSAAFFTSSSRRSLIVASAAAHATGLPR